MTTVHGETAGARATAEQNSAIFPRLGSSKKAVGNTMPAVLTKRRVNLRRVFYDQPTTSCAACSGIVGSTPVSSAKRLSLFINVFRWQNNSSAAMEMLPVRR